MAALHEFPLEPGLYWARFKTDLDEAWMVAELFRPTFKPEEIHAQVIGIAEFLRPTDLDWGARIERPVDGGASQDAHSVDTIPLPSPLRDIIAETVRTTIVEIAKPLSPRISQPASGTVFLRDGV